jgi:hypothetical protein
MPDGSRVYEFGPFRLDPAAHALYRNGVETPLIGDGIFAGVQNSADR